MTQPDDDMTIDELARAASLVVSTVRLYQNRGLLAGPTKRGRVGHYNGQHLARLRLIAQLQDRGFSLAGIKELLDGIDQGQSLHSVLGLGEHASTWATESSERIPLSELAELLPTVEFTPATIHRVMELGLVEFDADGSQVTVKSPSFLRIGRDLASLGVPAEEILDQYELLRRDADRIAARFTKVFDSHIWNPLVEQDGLTGHVAETVEVLETLGSLAEEVVVVALRHALQAQAAKFLQSEATRLGLSIPLPGDDPLPPSASDST